MLPLLLLHLLLLLLLCDISYISYISYTLYKSGIGITEIQHNLQNSLETMFARCTVNNMLVNPYKTKCMLIGPEHKLNSINLELKINDFCIELVESHKI